MRHYLLFKSLHKTAQTCLCQLVCSIFVDFLRLDLSLWSSQIYIVKFKRRPTKVWHLIRLGLMPSYQDFVIPGVINTWINIHNFGLLCEALGTLRQFTCCGDITTYAPSGFWKTHATLLAILTSSFQL